MATRKYMQVLMLLVFALLQGMAPLAHAHVNGHSEDHHIHLAGMDSHAVLAHDFTGPSATVEDDHARAVGMQPEFRSKKLELVKILLPDSPVLPVDMSAETACCFPASDTPRFSLPPYHHPVSQAPPV